MTISEQIRTLAGEGLATAEIAKRLGIRYQRRGRALCDAFGEKMSPGLTQIKRRMVGRGLPLIISPPRFFTGFVWRKKWSTRIALSDRRR